MGTGSLSTPRDAQGEEQAEVETLAGCAPGVGEEETCQAWQSQDSDPGISLEAWTCLCGLHPHTPALLPGLLTPSSPTPPLNMLLPAPHHPFPLENSGSPFRRWPQDGCHVLWHLGSGSRVHGLSWGSALCPAVHGFP